MAYKAILKNIADFCSSMVTGRPNATIFAIVIFIFLSAPFAPGGPVTANEEDYLAQSHKFVQPGAFQQFTSTISDSNGIAVFKFLMGELIANIGFEHAKTVVRLCGLLLYSVALAQLGAAVEISLFGLVASLVFFLRLGQSTMGGEWMFGAAESKVFGYAFVMLGMSTYFSGRAGLSRVFFCLSIYFHFLVGGAWMTFFFAAVSSFKGAAKTIKSDVLPILAGASPLLAVLAYEQFAYAHGGPDVGKTVDWIYSIFRSPHHAAPFSSTQTLAQFKPGFLLTPALCVLALGMAQQRSPGTGRIFGLTIFVAYLWLIVAIVLSYIFASSGLLGKLIMFRPASFALLLLFMHAAILAKDIALKNRAFAVYLFIAFVAPLVDAGFQTAVSARANFKLASIAAHPDEALNKYIYDNSPPTDVVLVDPALEPMLPERYVGRPTFVNYKFVPTRPDQIREWYARLLFRNKVASGDCDIIPRNMFSLPVKWMAVPAGSNLGRLSKCWDSVYSDNLAVLLRYRSPIP